MSSLTGRHLCRLKGEDVWTTVYVYMMEDSRSAAEKFCSDYCNDWELVGDPPFDVEVKDEEGNISLWRVKAISDVRYNASPKRA